MGPRDRGAQVVAPIPIPPHDTAAVVKALLLQHGGDVPLFINGEFVQSQATEFVDLLNPATQELLARVPETTPSELDAAVAAAEAALPEWRDTPVNQRQRVMFKLQALIREHTPALVRLLPSHPLIVPVPPALSAGLVLICPLDTSAFAYGCWGPQADNITLELGKVTADAHGDVFRGLEVVEYWCGPPLHTCGCVSCGGQSL